MKRSYLLVGIAGMAGVLMLVGGCEWSGGSNDSFNTSQGAGIQVNFSGVYSGNYPDGKAVETSSGSPITRLTLTEAGNEVNVIDNNGNKYKGNFGSPGLVFTPTTANPTIPAGAELMQAQINFEGKDGSSGHDVQFVGVIHVVTVSDIKSTTTSSGDNSSSSSSTVETQPTVTTQTHNDSTNTTLTITYTYPTYTLTEVIVTSDSTGQTISDTTTKTANSSQSTTQANTQTQTYSITEANSQYRLEGQWVEKGGNTSGVDALSPAGAGVVSTPIN